MAEGKPGRKICRNTRVIFTRSCIVDNTRHRGRYATVLTRGALWSLMEYRASGNNATDLMALI